MGDPTRDELRAEVERLTRERDGARAEVERLRTISARLYDVATFALPHTYEGLCSDPEQPDERDPSCDACKALIDPTEEGRLRPMPEFSPERARLLAERPAHPWTPPDGPTLHSLEETKGGDE